MQTSLVVQWLTICLIMQGTRVQSLVQEDFICCGTTKPLCQNYQAHTLETVLQTRGATTIKAHTLQQRVDPPAALEKSLSAARKTLSRQITILNLKKKMTRC